MSNHRYINEQTNNKDHRHRKYNQIFEIIWRALEKGVSASWWLLIGWKKIYKCLRVKINCYIKKKKKNKWLFKQLFLFEKFPEAIPANWEISTPIIYILHTHIFVYSHFIDDINVSIRMHFGTQIAGNISVTRICFNHKNGFKYLSKGIDGFTLMW